ncbi:myosin-11 [Echria macrotheca]|uniref:Myosin-11 n=1 Tax=Echria macrotheca TaxID=438768 RepID=A0AAJ0F793_9PEZI|nr:myosin-11 [Echria macrotheca]
MADFRSASVEPGHRRNVKDGGGGGRPAELRCCCGNEDCVFLRHNCSVLLSVERDVHTAAKMGQTLLARHEAYMASAERDRVQLMTRIEQLEHENSELECRNKSATNENQTLRDELDQLNDTVKDADTRIESLEATLRDSLREIRRLESAAERAASLERQIAMLEEEQATLQNTIVHTQEEARTAMYRWRQAEKSISELQEQLERMEKEAREERERHVEVIGRMERQRVMEKELNTAEGRLKGAAAVRSMTDGRGRGVVSHFVRDLLQDNANLQLGIAELREMLVSSNDEIQMLREQLLYHQPVPNRDSSSASTLRAELEHKEPPTPPRVSQELHIHHHYHVTHRPEAKKPKRRRQGITAGTFSPLHISAPSTPIAQHPMQAWQRGQFSPSRESTTPTQHGRWSIISESSEFAPSSVPSSPQSNPRNSIFDRNIVELSLPTSPTTSVDPTSPAWRTSHRKRASEASVRSITAPGVFPNLSPDQGHPLTNLILHGDVISEERTSPYTTDDVPDLTGAPSAGDATSEPMGNEAEFDPRVEQRPQRLRRVVSHESIMSLSNGMDIHTLKVRPSQLALRPLGLSAAGTNVSVVTARPTIARGETEGKRGSVLLRDMAGLTPAPKGREGRSVSGPVPSINRNRSSSRQPNALSRIVSWRPWGGGTNANPSPATSPTASPVITVSEIHVASSSAGSSGKSVPVSPHGSLSSTGTFRAPGINQPGGIPGFHEYWAAHQRKGPPSKVSVDDLGQIQEAMREILEEV